MAPKVLVSDKLSETAVQIFRDRGIDVDFMPDLGKDKEKLAEVIGQYDGLAIRSATKVTPTILKHATNLKVVGRAGIGTDNVDKEAASKQGVIVMNTPFGNMITTAEHAIAMMFAVARQIPEASESTHAGKWEKSKFMGVELTGKTLGVIGAGNIGGIVCDRARGLKMKVMAFDPFLGEEKAKQMGVQKIELDELLAAADFITLHVPFTESTKNILSRENLAKTKKGVRIINCARGGLVDEVALAELLQSGHVAGAAFDVFSVEPATENPLFNLPNVVCTPHLGAATTEAQENVALQVADQMSNYLLSGAVENALNMPSMTAEEAKIMGPWVKLADHLGNFVGQMTDEPITAINILYDGSVAGILEQGIKVRSLSLISPTGVGVRTPPTTPNGSRIDRVLSSRWVGKPLFSLLTTKPSIRWFLGQAFVGTTPEYLVRYALETASQPGAHHAPLKFLTFGLFTEQAITRLYSRLKLPCLVLYDRDPNIGFERLSELTEVHSHWAAKQLSPSLGLPHWELPAETIEALEDFWKPPGQCAMRSGGVADHGACRESA